MQVSQKQMLEHFLPIFKSQGKQYQKTSLIKAKKANEGETILTKTSDGVETKNTAQKGDYLVENQTSSSELYLVRENSFEKRYEMKEALEKGWATYQSKITIWAIEISKEDIAKLGKNEEICFEASWGESMILKPGDFLVTSPDFDEVYRIARKEFGETYRVV